MESSLVSMYAFRLNPRESSYVLDRLLACGRIQADVEITPPLFTSALMNMMSEHPMFYEMQVRIISTTSFPDERARIPNSFPYMILFGFPVPNGATYEEIQDIYISHPIFQHIRLLRRLFRERLGLHLQFTSDEAGLWTGHALPPVPFERPIVDTRGNV
jgi:hypothetical protein